MTWFTDGDKTADITLIGSHDVEFQDDFYDVGSLAGWITYHIMGSALACYCVESVDHLMDCARDMIAGVGDFDTPQPDVTLTVVWTGEGEDYAAMLDYIKAHREAIKSSAEAGHPCLDKGLFSTACDEYKMMSKDAEGFNYYLGLPVSGTVGLGVKLKSEVAVVYAVTPDGRHKLGWKAYEDFRDAIDVDDWFDGLQEEAYDKYVPEEEKEFIES